MARPGLFRHRKFSRLARALRSHILAVGVLETLWYVCGETCDDRVGAAEDVAFALKWDEKRIDIACVLHESGFLDCDDAGNYTVHDFWDHCPQYIKRRREREDSRRADGSATKARLVSGRTMASQRLVNGSPVASTPVSEQSSAVQSRAGDARPRAVLSAPASFAEFVWQCWRATSETHGQREPLTLASESYRRIKALEGQFSTGEVEAAIGAFWRSPSFAGKRHLHMCLANVPQLVAHVASGSARPFGERAATSATADDDGAARLAAWAAQGAAS